MELLQLGPIMSFLDCNTTVLPIWHTGKLRWVCLSQALLVWEYVSCIASRHFLHILYYSANTERIQSKLVSFNALCWRYVTCIVSSFFICIDWISFVEAYCAQLVKRSRATYGILWKLIFREITDKRDTYIRIFIRKTTLNKSNVLLKWISCSSYSSFVKNDKVPIKQMNYFEYQRSPVI